MMKATLPVRIKAFTRYLRGLAKTRDQQAFADLRNGLDASLASAVAITPHVLPFLSDPPEAADTWFYCVGALFTLNPRWEDDFSIGMAFAHLHARLPDRDRALFQALVLCPPEQLPGKLQLIVAVLAKYEIGIDWELLLSDLRQGFTSLSHVQQAWANDYARIMEMLEREELHHTRFINV